VLANYKSRYGGNMELSGRKRRILISAIEDYIKDCAPITSGNLKETKDMGCSSATLRAELNALEAMGYLRQLHTSGGRVPTAQGYRFYAENMLKEIKATDHELESVRKLIENRTQSLGDIVSGIAKIVSHATNYPTVVVMNGIENLILKDFKSFRLWMKRLWCLLAQIQDISLKILTSKQACKNVMMLRRTSQNISKERALVISQETLNISIKVWREKFKHSKAL